MRQTHCDRFRALPPVDAEQLVARFHQGVPKRQLAREYGIALTTVKWVLRRHRG
jgi:DNA invertase Pin-like site-specific DNA recombinase